MADNARCDNCGAVTPIADLNEPKRLSERLDQGGTVPAGECPKCGALAYPLTGQIIVVLNDGETFSAIDGCQLVIVPEDEEAESIEAALGEGHLLPALTLSSELGIQILGEHAPDAEEDGDGSH